MFFKKIKKVEIDPVCWMKVETVNGKSEFQYLDGTKLFHFCAKSCLEIFSKDPKKALQFGPPQGFGGAENTMAQKESHSGGKYVCPMCPEVENEGPAACPKCGMALEPLSIQNADSALEYEMNELKKGLKGSVIFGAPVVFLSMIHMFFPSILNHQWHLIWNVIQAVFSFVVMAGYGRVWLVRAFDSFKTLSLNMFSLIGLGLLVSYLYSLVFTILGIFVHEYANTMVYFESVCAIVILVFIGQLLEVKARYKTGDALRSLFKLIPKKTLVVLDEETDTQEKDVSEIKVSQRIRVLPGGKIPLDGKVISGSASVDESVMTGESLPVFKNIGKGVFAGTHCLDGSIDIEVTKASNDTILSQIINHVAEAQRTRAPIQKLVDKVSAIFVPSVFIVSLLTFILWWVFDSALVGFVQSVSVLMIACPCALGLATPMSIMVANGRAAKLGILIKNSEVLEYLSKLDKIAFDKTGTLTHGNLVLEKFSSEDKAGMEFLQIAASLEAKSEHPIAKGILKKASQLEIALKPVEDFKVLPGKGVEGIIDGKHYFCGLNRNELKESGSIESQERNNSLTTTIVLRDLKLNQDLYTFELSDAIREESKEVVSKLQKLGIEVFMISGDKENVAIDVARKVGISKRNVIFRATPEVKLNWIKNEQNQSKVVAMVGDGINDTPALTQANVGFAVKSGTDTAKQVAGVQILQSKISGIADAIFLGRETQKNIRQNLFFAFFYNTVGIPIAAGLFIKPFGLGLSPLFASVAMSLSSLCVIANALRLGRKHLG